MITELIEAPDVVELVRDRIAALLLEESNNQKVLAAAAVPPKDPALWALRIFVERTNPWAEFYDGDESLEDVTINETPIVNVSFDSSTQNKSKSNTISGVHTTATFNVDVYAVGVSKDTPEGHTPGDAAAAIEVARAVRLVRKILMAGEQADLGMTGVVGERWVAGITAFQPSIDGETVQQIVANRIVFEVSFREDSPQVSGEPFEGTTVTVKRAGTGEIYFTARYGGDEEE